MNHSGVSSNGQGCSTDEICEIEVIPIPVSTSSPARMGLAGKAGNVNVNSISPERAKQIKEEVLEMQRKRFKTSTTKRKSTSDLKNKTSPKKCSKIPANSSPYKKVSNLCLNKEVAWVQKIAPESGRLEFESDTQTNGEDKNVRKMNVETVNARNTVTVCFNKNISEPSSPVIHANKDSATSNQVAPSESKNIIFVDLVDDDDDDDDFQKSGKKPRIAEGKACEISNGLSVNKKPQKEAAQKLQNANVKTSKYSCGRAVSEGPLNLSVKNNELKANIPHNQEEQLVEPSNQSGNVLHDKLPECSSKAQHNQLCGASSNETSNIVESSNKFAGSSNCNNGSDVTCPNLIPQKNEKEQQKLQTIGNIFSESLLNGNVKLSPKIRWKPNRYGISSSSSENGLQLVMAPGGSGKRKSPRSYRVGKNSPIKVFRSPYSKELKSLQADKQRVRKSLNFEDPEEEAPTSGFICYAANYVQYFVKIMVEVLDNSVNKNLVSDGLVTIDAFMQLKDDAKKLYVRMLGRKLKWHRVNDIHYSEITSVHESFEELERAGFVKSDFEGLNLEDMLILLKKKELGQLCKLYKIKPTHTKPRLIESLMEYGKNQMSVGVDSTATVLWKSGVAQLGYCIKLCEEHREIFHRILMLFSITHQETAADRQLSKMLMLMHYVESKQLIYPSYKILRTRPVFPSRDDMFGREVADQLLDDLLASIDRKDWETVRSLGAKTQKCFRELLQDEEKSKAAKQLPLFLRRYSAGSVYAKAITHAVEGFKKTKTTVEDAVIALRELLSQHIYSPHYRGRWYDTLALLLHSHLREVEETAQLIVEALNDDAVTEEFQHSLSIRGSRLLKVLKEDCADLKLKLKELLKQPLNNIPEVTVKARALDSNLPGYKKVYIEKDTGETTFSSVEELVLARYKKDFPEAIHGESSPVRTLFTLLFWDIIYHQAVPDVFQSPYQIEPLDLLSGEFYANRKEAIDKRLQNLNEWSIEEYQWMVKDIYKEHVGKTSLVNWNRFRNVNQILNVIKCIGPKVLSRIMERFAKHYKYANKGFPDLMLWAPARNECLFVEVKGPRDKLAVCQQIWLSKLIEFGARAEVCHVLTTGSKILKRKSPEGTSEGTLHNKTAENENICIELSE